MRVAFLSSEVVPFSKSGGLGDVAGALPAALARLGVDVVTVSPLYRSVRKFPLEPLPHLITVPIGSGAQWGAVRRSGIHHFLEHELFYDRDGLYQDARGEYRDNAARFIFLCRGALEFLRQAGPPPDVIHVNDWPTGLVPLYLKTLYAGSFPRTKSVFTIHNIAYQGRFWHFDMVLAGLDWRHYNARELEFRGEMNFLKGGLVHADRLTTVSPTYARELQTSEYGWGLEGVLRDRAADFSGILNGIDTDEWDPSRDPHLAARYSAARPEGKAACKADLQRKCGFPVRADLPLLAIVGRLAEQKGVDFFLGAADTILSRDVQVVVLGSGDSALQNGLRWFAWRYPGKLHLTLGFDVPFSHRIMAGADMLLVPSRYEPCGLTQMYALRYGTVPVVRSTGGLVDTVDPGVTGFRFDHYAADALRWAVDQALEAFADLPRWNRIRQAGMVRDFGWDTSAREYLRLYESLVPEAQARTKSM